MSIQQKDPTYRRLVGGKPRSSSYRSNKEVSRPIWTCLVLVLLILMIMISFVIVLLQDHKISQSEKQIDSLQQTVEYYESQPTIVENWPDIYATWLASPDYKQVVPTSMLTSTLSVTSQNIPATLYQAPVDFAAMTAQGNNRQSSTTPTPSPTLP